MISNEELDAYEAALAAERDLANGIGDEDPIDYWLGQADQP